MSPAPPPYLLVQDFLATSARRLRDKVALVCENRRLTYSEIDDSANRLANALRHHGLKRGDRAVIFLKNSVEAVIGLFAILRAGGTFVLVNHTTRVEKLTYILNECDARFLLLDAKQTDSGYISVLAQSVPSLKYLLVCRATPSHSPECPCTLLNYDSLLAEFQAAPPSVVNIDLDVACLIYTSGSTGAPKGVICDHASVTFAATSIVKYLENAESDIICSVLPLSFTYGLYQVFTIFQVGGTLVLENSFAYPATVLETMQRERVTGFPAVPTIYSILLRTDLAAYDLSSLRYLTNAAAPLSPGQVLRIQNTFPHAAFYSMYGQTETARSLYLPPSLLQTKPGSVGIAIPGTEVWLEDEEGLRLGHGQIGELVVRGRNVMRGYWASPAATAERFVPGPVPGERVCRTGDLFTMDEDGCFYFVSRKDDIIKCKGEKVAPKEVENVLYLLKGVIHAAVTAVPDPIVGQAIKAFLVLEGSSYSVKEVQRHCRAHLEDFMVPKYVEFRQELPMTASGKIKRAELI